jgi:hypothetical protein
MNANSQFHCIAGKWVSPHTDITEVIFVASKNLPHDSCNLYETDLIHHIQDETFLRKSKKLDLNYMYSSSYSLSI